MLASKIIFENQHYTTCHMKDGSLIVTHKRMGLQPLPCGHSQRKKEN